ncbi:MAG: hypothetical protein GX684_03990 [Ruminococcaceae bacterium]|nr:hypothetical protein [Oscillospiraceae bacterium]
MKKRLYIGIIAITLILLISACANNTGNSNVNTETKAPDANSANEPKIVNTIYANIESPGVGSAKDTDKAVFVTYYELSDGTWKTDTHTYKYRLEITGKLSGTQHESKFVYLSNIEEISFEQALKASGLSSNMNDYFKKEDAILVSFEAIKK